jgi:hypothetical protein
MPGPPVLLLRMLLLLLSCTRLATSPQAAGVVEDLWDRYSVAMRASRDAGGAAVQLRAELTEAVVAATERNNYAELQELGLRLRKTEADFGTQVGAAQDMYDEFSAPLMRAFAALLERTAVHPACSAHFRSHAVHESRCSTIRASVQRQLAATAAAAAAAAIAAVAAAVTIRLVATLPLVARVDESTCMCPLSSRRVLPRDHAS